MPVEPRAHRAHGYLGSLPLREAERAGGHAAEGDRAAPARGGGLEAALVARGQLAPVPVGGRAVCDGAHRVQHPAGRQVVCVRDLRAAGWLRMSLPLHELRARQAQLHAGERVDGVVDAVVPRYPAAQERAVRRVDDGVRLERGYVAAPHGKPRIGRRRRQRGGARDARLRDEAAQQPVLHLEEPFVRRARLARVDERPELGERLVEGPPLGRCLREAPLFQQVPHQVRHVLVPFARAARRALRSRLVRLHHGSSFRPSRVCAFPRRPATVAHPPGRRAEDRRALAEGSATLP